MKTNKIYIVLITCSTLLSGSVWAQTGIGTTSPVNKFEVVTTAADPASSGATANGNLRIGATITNVHVLDFGLSSTSTFSWLQARSKSAYGTTYNLALNPIGGNVGIGTTNPTAKLNIVGGGIRIFNGFSNNSTARPALNEYMAAMHAEHASRYRVTAARSIAWQATMQPLMGMVMRQTSAAKCSCRASNSHAQSVVAATRDAGR
jgi:hypothetical protein